VTLVRRLTRKSSTSLRLSTPRRYGDGGAGQVLPEHATTGPCASTRGRCTVNRSNRSLSARSRSARSRSARSRSARSRSAQPPRKTLEDHPDHHRPPRSGTDPTEPQPAGRAKLSSSRAALLASMPGFFVVALNAQIVTSYRHELGAALRTQTVGTSSLSREPFPPVAGAPVRSPSCRLMGQEGRSLWPRHRRLATNSRPATAPMLAVRPCRPSPRTWQTRQTSQTRRPRPHLARPNQRASQAHFNSVTLINTSA